MRCPSVSDKKGCLLVALAPLPPQAHRPRAADAWGMTTSVSAYTNLESLLLFQCLHAYGVGPSVFGSISDLLKKNPDVTAHKYFQAGRLSPDALRNFYLERLKRELEYEQGGDSEGQHGGEGATSAKRKRQSPTLPTVQESLQHQHLIPKLVTKLYASYRYEITEQITAEEDRYERLQRELKSIECGEWDDQLRERANGRTPPTPQPQPLAAPVPSQQNLTQPLAPPPQPGPHHNFTHTPRPRSPAPQFQPRPAQTYAGNGTPQYGPPGNHPQYPPAHQYFSLQQAPGPHSPGLHPPQQQQRTQYSHPGHQPYSPLQPQLAHPPPQAGFMLPPFQVAPQDPSRVHHQAAAPPQLPQVSTPASDRQQSRPNLQTPSTGRPGMPQMHPLVIQARQSLSTPMSARSPQSAMGTPVSAKSFWKRQSFHGTPLTPASPRPEMEPLDDVPPLIRAKQTPSKVKAQRKSRTKGKSKEAVQESVSETGSPQDPKPPNDRDVDNLLEPETRSGRSRRKAAAKRKRPGSIASSRAGGSIRDRSRSQSVLSHTETVAADNESQADNRIKSERGTSVDAIEEEATETPSHMSTRRRGGRNSLAPASASTRRKRNAREASLEEAEDALFSTPGPRRTLVAPRNFARMTAPMMYDINSHKHASTFNTAVRAKDAEGYYDIIKRPTDLASIKKAIATGSKQVASAAASDTPTGSPGGAGGVVELPVTLDNVPPKAIVNAAQLEKELMRMFVNAVMFNPGEEGVVHDARDMFHTVQGLVSTWRDVERDSGRLGNEGTPIGVVEEDEQPSAPKRRKM
ncbi:hypothetical protein BDW02DRAFT_260181 [Decorospora gaudefroyi]|uniref:Bromo domain-containing protein n=1 Tax=Decorospora gaudefroyi TaxID=184978 RepID=A0A6A5KK20_9PLEO|nr:hypothetical protein BDW02DRAFT_260181 [Decorospora gaudefroyi]